MADDLPFDLMVRAIVTVIRGDGGFLTPEAAAARDLPPVPQRALALIQAAAPLHDDGFAETFRAWVLAMPYREDDLWRIKKALLSGWGEIPLALTPLLARTMVIHAREEKHPLVGDYALWPIGERRETTLRIMTVRHDDREANYGQGAFIERHQSCLLIDLEGHHYQWNRLLRPPEGEAAGGPPPWACEGEWWRLKATVKARLVDERGRAVTVIERVKLDRRVVGPR